MEKRKEQETRIKEFFLKRLSQIFDVPRATTEIPNPVDQWAEILARSCPKADQVILTAAADSICATRKTKTFPQPAHCIEAIRAGRNPKSLQAENENLVSNLGFEDAKETHQFARQVFNCDLGQTALREDWHQNLYDFIRRFLRLPTEFEIAEMKVLRRQVIDRRPMIAQIVLHQSRDLQRMAKAFEAGQPKRRGYFERIFDRAPVPIDPVWLAAAREAFERKRKRASDMHRRTGHGLLETEFEIDARVRLEWEKTESASDDR